MGINLWDIGAVATGAIERDREHTAENLKIRSEHPIQESQLRESQF